MTDAQRCLDPACLDGPDGARWATHGLLCRRCADKLEQRLAELPARRDALRSVLGGLGAGVKGGNRPTKGSPPIPLNITAHDHLTAMQAVVVSWVRMVCEERDLRGPDRDDLAVLARWLLSQLDWLLQHPAAGDLADEIRELHRTAEGIARVNPRWNRLPVACPSDDCGAHEVGRMDGGDHVECRACGRVWPEAEYARFVLVAASDPAFTLTATEAAKRLDIPAGTFRRWVHEGQIKRLGTAEGLARYRIEDIDRLKQQEAS